MKLSLVKDAHLFVIVRLDKEDGAPIGICGHLQSGTLALFETLNKARVARGEIEHYNPHEFYAIRRVDCLDVEFGDQEY